MFYNKCYFGDEREQEFKDEIETCADSVISALFCARRSFVPLALLCAQILVYSTGTNKCTTIWQGVHLAGRSTELQTRFECSPEVQKILAKAILDHLKMQNHLNAFEVTYLAAIIMLLNLNEREEIVARQYVLSFLHDWRAEIYRRGCNEAWFQKMENYADLAETGGQHFSARDMSERMIKFAVITAHKLYSDKADDFVIFCILLHAVGLDKCDFTLGEALHLYIKHAFRLGAEEPFQAEIDPALLQFLPFQVCHRGTSSEEESRIREYLSNVANIDCDAAIPAREMIALIAHSIFRLKLGVDYYWMDHPIYHPANMMREAFIPAPVTAFVWFNFDDLGLRVSLDTFGTVNSIYVPYPFNERFDGFKSIQEWKPVIQIAERHLLSMGLDPAILILSVPERTADEKKREIARILAGLQPLKAVGSTGCLIAYSRTEAALISGLDRISGEASVAVIYEDVFETELAVFRVRNGFISCEKTTCVSRCTEKGNTDYSQIIRGFSENFFEQYSEGEVIRVTVRKDGIFSQSTIESLGRSEEYPGVFLRGSQMYQFFSDEDSRILRFRGQTESGDISLKSTS